jgi:hypothetical protein
MTTLVLIGAAGYVAPRHMKAMQAASGIGISSSRLALID